MSKAAKVDPLTQERQARAADPKNSAWVGANAGSGKTFVLARRVIRLLLSGAQPAKILCLTFTKAAAAEMSERVFKELANWATASDGDLHEILLDLTGKPARPAMLSEARKLFARALETPGGLKIQTIHAFCERLLHQFPVEANVAGHFEVLDDFGRMNMLRDAERVVLLEAAENPGGAVAAALGDVVAHSSDAGYREALDAFQQESRAIMGWLESEGGVAGAVKALRAHFGLQENDTVAGLKEQMLDSPHLPPVYFEGYVQELCAASKKFADLGAVGRRILDPSPVDARAQAVIDFFYTAAGGRRAASGFAAKAMREDFTDLDDRVAREHDRLDDLMDRQAALLTIDATRAILTVASEVAAVFTAKKAATGMMDFDDLVEKTADLLQKEGAAAWVHYKLDQGLDHILVDEAQDTSPRQWDVVARLADEFFAGEGARQNDRTIFAVGDEKQSIYSFQGASPEWFEKMRRHFETKARGAEKPFEKIPLSLSFRSTADILGAVDVVFERAPLVNSLVSDEQNYQPHSAHRQNQPGFVELFAPFAKPDKKVHTGEWWEPLDRLSEASTEKRLADCIADKIKGMVESGERLEGTGKAITPGDILILTRKRGPQVEAINRALKDRGLPVAGSDRLKLMESIAVLDLLALTDFTLLSEDDLALAGLLKSPLIGLSEDALFTLAHGREGTLWRALYSRALKNEAPYAEAYNVLDRWRREADFVPPYDFFLRILARDGGRAAFISALGPETDEVLEAFLSQVLTFEQSVVPTLQGFGDWFRNGAVEIKRDMEGKRDDIRVMTVHGSKGLEADVVFLVDGGQPYHANTHDPVLVGLGEGGVAPFIWKRGKGAATRAQKLSLERERAAIMDEYYRLLYVAMTRARDRLYMLATANTKGEPQKDGWFATVHHGLSQSEFWGAGEEAFAGRWQKTIGSDVVSQDDNDVIPKTFKEPSWVHQSAPEPPKKLTSLTPSGMGGLGEVTADHQTDFQGGDTLAVDPLERGLLIHKLLEHLPKIAPADREAVARAYLNHTLTLPDKEIVQAIVKEVFGVLDHGDIAPIFEGQARTEVPVAGDVEINGVRYAVRGEIDRLVVRDRCVHLIDYKTNRHVPETPEAVSDGYKRQLALYKRLLEPLFPGHTFEISLIWTRKPLIMQMPESVLENSLQQWISPK